MPTTPQATPSDEDVTATPESLRAAWLVSLQSIVWTVFASTAAVVIGVTSGSGVLVAFGAIGFVDALGSAALVYHFGHAIRHERISVYREQVAHRIVVVGLVTVGFATIVVNAARLILGSEGEASDLGVLLAAISLLVLTALSARKRTIARRVSSRALRADGHLSAVGATLAAITLAGTVATRQFGWHWADAAAAILVGGIAMHLGIASAGVGKRTRPRLRASQFAWIGFALTCGVAAIDALLGDRVVLIGLLVLGPACAAVSLRPRPTFAVSLWAVALAVALGVADGIWATYEHLAFTAAVVVVGIVNTTVVAIVGAYMSARLPTGAPERIA